MTTTTSDLANVPHPAVVALPPKAVEAEDWQPIDGDRYYRHFEGENREVVAGTRYGAHAVVVYAHGVQHNDAAIHDGSNPILGPPRISFSTIDDAEDGVQTNIGISLTSEAARQLADVLVTAADEADGWSTR